MFRLVATMSSGVVGPLLAAHRSSAPRPDGRRPGCAHRGVPRMGAARAARAASGSPGRSCSASGGTTARSTAVATPATASGQAIPASARWRSGARKPLLPDCAQVRPLPRRTRTGQAQVRRCSVNPSRRHQSEQPRRLIPPAPATKRSVSDGDDLQRIGGFGDGIQDIVLQAKAPCRAACQFG